MKLRKFIFHYWKSIIIISGILYLSFAPPSTFNGVPSFENEDKLVHIIMYMGLTGVLIFDFKKYAKNNPKPTFAFVITCLLFPIILGGAVEILQPLYFAPRTAEWSDWFSDSAGVLVGWLVMSLVMPKLIKKTFK
ncbi:MAG: VanZ family protein [Bacteroidota bacterium]|nr:VanZ family protein [Bacteroidota bacterium]